MGRHGTIPVDDYLRGIAHNMQLSACQRVAEETDSEWNFLLTFLTWNKETLLQFAEESASKWRYFNFLLNIKVGR